MVRIIFTLIILCFGVCGCKKKELACEDRPLRINFTYEPFSVDPRKCTDPITTTMNFMLYEGLTRLEPDGTISLALAKKVKVSKDRKKYTFSLRPSMWSDGSPLTAYHFEAAWKKALSPEFVSRTSHLLYSIKNGEEAKQGKCSLDDVGIQALDETTLVVRLERPLPYFLQLTSYPAFFPVPFNGDEVAHPMQGGEVLGNGPFLLSSWNREQITVHKNPYYWNAKTVALPEIQISLIGDEPTALNLFDKNELDMVGGLTSPLPLDALPSLKEENRLESLPIAGTTFSAFNVERFPFNNIHIRKAFVYAINREAITQGLSQMLDEVSTGPVPPVMQQSAQVFFQDNYKFLAKVHFEKGLEELGITKEQFPTITYTFFTSELQKKLATILQIYWKDVLGIEVKLQAEEFKTHLASLKGGKFSIAQMSWIAQYHDPMTFLERFTKKDAFRNYSRWENSKYHDLIETSNTLMGEERDACLLEAETILMSEMPINPLFHFHLTYVKNPSLRGIAISPLGDIQFHHASFCN